MITSFANIASELRTAIKRLNGRGVLKLLLVAGCLLLVFNSSFGQANGDYRTIGNVTFAASLNWERYNGSAWVAAGAAPVIGDNIITIRTGNTATLTTNKALDQLVVASGGVLTVNSGQNLTIPNGVGTDLSVSGTINNSGTITPGGTIVFNASSAYNHTQDGGTIPDATWNASSNCNITGVTANEPGGLNQSFGNFTWNCPGQTGIDLNINPLEVGNGGAVTGDFTLISTGVGSIRLSNNVNRVLDISGNFNISGGTFHLAIAGGSATVNIGGDFNMTGGTLTETGTSSVIFVFNNGGTTQNFRRTIGTISNNIGFTVNSNVTIDFGTNDYANGGGTFTLSNGATLQTANTTGINGSIQTTSRSLSASANYTFDGTLTQVTGTYLPTTVNNFTINNTNGVTLSQTITINGAYSSNGQFSTAFNINFNGTTVCGGSIVASAGTVTYSNTALNIIAGSYNRLTKSGAAAVTLCGPITVNGSLSTGGQINTPFDLTLNGTTVCGGSINASAGTVSYSNATANILAGTYRNLIILAGVTTATLCNTITINGNLTIENSAVLQNSGNYDIYLAGNWTDNNTGDGFVEGTGEVFFNGTIQQTITKAGGTGSESFYDLNVNNSNGLYLASGDLNATHRFSFAGGNITFANSPYKVYLSAGTPTSLNYTSVTGSRIIGKFERGINTTGTYLFPIGTSTNYNPANLVINAAPGAGSVLTEFVSGSPGNAGLPINEGGVEVSDAYTDGYWSFTARNGFSDGNYNINLNGTGFLTAIFDITRIIKRTSGGNWGFDGTHANASGAVCYRNNLTGGISSAGTHFGFGHTRPLITDQPGNQPVCENATASFSIVATGNPPLTYQWYKAPNIPLIEGGRFTGTNLSTISIANIVLGDAGNYYCIVTDGHGSTVQSISATVTVNTLPVPTLAGPTPVCVGVTGNVYTTEAGMSNYLWTVSAGGTITAGGGTGNNTVTVTWTTTGAKTVSVNYTNVNGCSGTSSTIFNVTVNPLPVPTLAGPTPVCVDVTGNVYATEAGMSNYIWTVSAGGTITAGEGTGNNMVTVTWTTTGAKTVTVNNTNVYGCTATSPTTYNVTVNPLPAATASNNGPLCAGSALNITGGAAGMTTYSWTGPNGFISALQSPSVSASATVAMAGVYVLMVTNASGCTNTATTTVVVNTLPLVNISSSNSPMCMNDLRTLTGSPVGGTFIISDGPGTITGNVLSATGIGTINVEYNYTNVCAYKALQSIIVNEKPVAFAGPDQEMTFIFETQMTAELSSSETGEWSLISGSGHISDIHSPTTRVTELSIGENMFLWKVQNGNCEASAEVKITIHDLFVPSVITPNGDSKNDYFKISENIGKVELIIVNRWGNVEYTNGNYLNDWDGRNNKGTELPDDTYFYVLKFENGKIKKGSVLIKR